MRNSRETFLSRLSNLASLCDFVLTKDLIALYDRFLFSQVGYEKAAAALEWFILNRKATDRFPSAADIASRGGGQPTTEHTANRVANLICTAISKFGKYRPTSAREYMGDIAWQVVQTTHSSWSALCTSIQLESQIGILRAQLEKAAVAVIKSYEAGTLDKVPSFGDLDRSALPRAKEISSLLPMKDV